MNLKRFKERVFLASALSFLVLGVSGCSDYLALRSTERALQENRLEQVFAITDQKIAEGCEEPWIYANRAQANFRSGRYEAARTDIEKAKELGIATGFYHLISAQIDMGERNFVSALDHCDKAEKLNPENALIQEFRSSAEAYIRKCEESEALMKTRLQAATSPGAKNILLRQLAKLKFYNLGRQPEALADLESARALMPGEVLTLDTYTWFLMMKRDASAADFSTASALLKEALRQPENQKNLLLADNYAAASALNGDFETAVLWQKNALALLPGAKLKSAPYKGLEKEMNARLNLYLNQQAYREAPGSVRMLWMFMQEN